MKLLTVRHATTFRYARPVAFGQHRLMLGPRDSHDLRLVSAELTLSPPGNIRWMHDVFGNSVALVDFRAPGGMLSIVSNLKIERYGLEGPAFPIAPEAEFYPFIYSSSDRVDLGRLLEQHYPDPDGTLARWADSFVTSRPMRTLDLLKNLNAALAPHIVYGERHELGMQSPAETLRNKTRACRDFAMVLIEAARNLGLGARFVSGYVYQRSTKSDATPATAATHAWADLPARRRLDRLRPDRRLDRRRDADPRCRHPRSLAGGADYRQLYRRECGFSRHERGSDGHRAGIVHLSPRGEVGSRQRSG